MSELPPALAGALDRALEGVSRKDLATRAARTSATYRAGGGSAEVIQGAADALAYALVRLPATYAANAAVLAEAQRLAPGFTPRRLLDVGSGPGAASWAALETWPSMDAATWLERSAPFLELAHRLAAGTPLARAEALRRDLTADGDWPRAELVTASYALAEIAEARLSAVVDRLWAATKGVLTIVEPGTPAGFQRLLRVRERLVDAGADLLAPCPHARACPLVAPDWCHFSIRLPRRRDHLAVKGAEVPFEDEKFAYLIAARPGIAPAQRRPRVLAPPRVNKGGTALKLCGPEGVEERSIGRRDKVAFAHARRLGWGDAFDP